MKTLVIEAPAKINLFLDVKGKRNDGYHELALKAVLIILASIKAFIISSGSFSPLARSISLICPSSIL
jgi:4-diphosphocytidyl-2-C-methyl-D-erythritol kinase